MYFSKNLRVPKEIAEQAMVIAQRRGQSFNSFIVESIVRMIAESNMALVRKNDATHQ